MRYPEIQAQNQVRRQAEALATAIEAAILIRREADGQDRCADLLDYCPPSLRGELLQRLQVSAERQEAAACYHQVAAEDGGPPRCQQFERVCYRPETACRFFVPE